MVIYMLDAIFILASCNRGQSKIKLWIGGLILFVLMGFKTVVLEMIRQIILSCLID